MHIAIDDGNTLGSHVKDYVCFAALCGSDNAWREFADRWRACLERYSLPHLHTADFLNNHVSYSNLPQSRGEREDIVAEFSKIIVSSVEYGYVVAVDKQAYDALTKVKRKRLSAQTFCFYRVVAQVTSHVNQGYITELLSFMVDDSSNESPKLLSLWQKMRAQHAFSRDLFVGISFCDDKHTYPVQAADLMANSAVKELRRGPLAFDSDSPIKSYSPISMQGRMVFESEIWEHEHIEANMQIIEEGAKFSA